MGYQGGTGSLIASTNINRVECRGGKIQGETCERFCTNINRVECRDRTQAVLSEGVSGY